MYDISGSLQKLNKNKAGWLVGFTYTACINPISVLAILIIKEGKQIGADYSWSTGRLTCLCLTLSFIPWRDNQKYFDLRRNKITTVTNHHQGTKTGFQTPGLH